jgi:hypothetical protein
MEAALRRKVARAPFANDRQNIFLCFGREHAGLRTSADAPGFSIIADAPPALSLPRTSTSMRAPDRHFFGRNNLR